MRIPKVFSPTGGKDTAGLFIFRGSLGLDGHNVPFRTALMPERYRCLDTQYLRDLRKTWRPELFPDTLQDEYAIATILLDMADNLRGGARLQSISCISTFARR